MDNFRKLEVLEILQRLLLRLDDAALMVDLRNQVEKEMDEILEQYD